MTIPIKILNIDVRTETYDYSTIKDPFKHTTVSLGRTIEIDAQCNEVYSMQIDRHHKNGDILYLSNYKEESKFPVMLRSTLIRINAIPLPAPNYTEFKLIYINNHSHKDFDPLEFLALNRTSQIAIIEKKDEDYLLRHISKLVIWQCRVCGQENYPDDIICNNCLVINKEHDEHV